MAGLDRKRAPLARQVEEVNFPEVEFYTLKNGIPVYLMNFGTQDIIKMDVVMEAGQWFSENILTASFCNRMLIEGSQNYSNAEIAEKIDYLGTFTGLDCGRHYANTQIYCLNHFFAQSVEILEDFVKRPVFPEEKLNVIVQKEIQQYVVNHEKTEVLASDEFIPRIFGQSHPYGRIRKPEDYRNLNVEHIRQFHRQYYNALNCRIMVSGKLNGEIMPVLEEYFGGSDWQGAKAVPATNGFQEPETGKYTVGKAGAVQSSILIGKRTITKKHPDYAGFSILNTILGGYFGSRLMTNLREKNALTYGIYSGLSSLLQAGSFSIAASVNNEKAEKAISQIYKEIDLLKEKLVPEQELEMVRNYLAGEMLRAFEGPIALSEIFMELLAYGLDFESYRQFFSTLRSISPAALRDLANKYLQKDTFVEVIAGDYPQNSK